MLLNGREGGLPFGVPGPEEIASSGCGVLAPGICPTMNP